MKNTVNRLPGGIRGYPRMPVSQPYKAQLPDVPDAHQPLCLCSTHQQQQHGQQQQWHSHKQALLVQAPLPVQPHHCEQQHSWQPQQQQRQYSSRAVSLARALHLQPHQTAAMMRDFPPLTNFNHSSLADKLQEMAGLLQLPPTQLSAALVVKPQVLGASLQAVEARVGLLQHTFGSLQAVQQLVLQDPSWLTWGPKHLRKRLQDMASCLGLEQQELLHLLQQQPQLLDASRWLTHSLGLLQHLLQLAAAAGHAAASSDKSSSSSAAAAAGLGVVYVRQASAHAHKSAATATTAAGLGLRSGGGGQLHQQRQQQQHDAAAGPQHPLGTSTAAARAFAVHHPQLLLLPPDELVARVAALQAQAGLPLAEVAAVLVANPDLLLSGANSGSSNGGSRDTGRGASSSALRSRRKTLSTPPDASNTAEEGKPLLQSSAGDGSSSRGRVLSRTRQPGKQFWDTLGQ